MAIFAGLTFTKSLIMFERTQTINGTEYAYNYGGHGTIAVTAPLQATIDLKQMPNISVEYGDNATDDQKAGLAGALQAIVSDMFAQMPRG